MPFATGIPTEHDKSYVHLPLLTENRNTLISPIQLNQRKFRYICILEKIKMSKGKIQMHKIHTIVVAMTKKHIFKLFILRKNFQLCNNAQN